MKINGICDRAFGAYCFEAIFNSYDNKEDIFVTLANLIKLTNKSLYKIIKITYNYRDQHPSNSLVIENPSTDIVMRKEFKILNQYVTSDMDINDLKNITFTYYNSLYYFRLYLKALSMPISLENAIDIISIENNVNKEDIKDLAITYLINFASILDYKNYKNLLKKKRKLSKFDIYDHIISLVENSIENDTSINYVFHLIMINFNLSKNEVINILKTYTHSLEFSKSKLSKEKKYTLIGLINNPNNIITIVDTDKDISNFCFKYFNMYLKALSLNYNIDYALRIVSFEEGTSISDIKKYTKIYLENYADKEALEKYNRYLNKHNNTDTSTNDTVFDLVWQDDLTEDLLDKSTSSNIYSTKLPKYFDYLLGNSLYSSKRQYLLKRQDEIQKHYHFKRRKNVNPAGLSEEDINLLMNYIHSNSSYEDYYSKNKEVHTKYDSAYHFYTALLRMVKKDKELYKILLDHENRIHEYEISYYDTLLDTILPFLNQGIPTKEGTRNFTLLDYYFLTTYLPTKLKTRLSKYPMSKEDRKLVSQLFRNISNTFEINEEHFINTYNTTRYFNDTYRSLSLEEKQAIIEYFKENNIPLYESLIEEFITNYAKGRVFLPERRK